MFKKILIANRGEIAVRVIRACKEMDIRTVAIYSEADRESMAAQLADEAVCVGPAPVPQSYLNIPNIISAALISGADAVHPGYGFLAENAEFVEICGSHGLTFIGPSARAMSLMGDKAAARATAAKAGVPVLPGTGVIESADEAVTFAKAVGFPVIIKAVAGGGGKGMRVAMTKEELLKSLELAQNEAQAAFGDGRIYVEKYLLEPRHIEFQLLGDTRGQVIHLGERDCSVQRRKQKLVEEAPSQGMTEELRSRMGAAAVTLGQAVQYTTTGTIEYLLDRSAGAFYFMEMNTRIQVEHPVTELVTGLDLVKGQIAVAAGEPLPVTQDRVRITGHAIECRINAEDPDKNFAPSCGTITGLRWPGGPGVRVDSHITAGSVIQPYYDSLLAKIITHGATRDEALARMNRALGEFRCEGVMTTVPFHQMILDNAFFRQGDIHTTFVEDQMAAAGAARG